MQGKTTGGDVIDALPEAHGKSARIEQRAAIQFRYLVVRDLALEPVGHSDPPEMAVKFHVKFYSMARQTAKPVSRLVRGSLLLSTSLSRHL